jgi:hypothetical protein
VVILTNRNWGFHGIERLIYDISKLMRVDALKKLGEFYGLW